MLGEAGEKNFQLVGDEPYRKAPQQEPHDLCEKPDASIAEDFHDFLGKPQHHPY